MLCWFACSRELHELCKSLKPQASAAATSAASVLGIKTGEEKSGEQECRREIATLLRSRTVVSGIRPA